MRFKGGDRVRRADRLEARDLTVVGLAWVQSWMVEDQREQEGLWMWIRSVRYDGARLLRKRIAFTCKKNK